MRFIYIVCFVFLFYSCVKKSKLNEDSINIEMPVNNQDSFNLSQYVDSVAYVKLQTLDDLVINRISRIKIFDNRIYIQDSKLKSLFVFDSKGLFLYSIRDVGGGPHEYIDLTQFCIDEINKLIVIYDLPRNRILNFNSKDGGFVSLVNVNERRSFARDFTLMSNGDYLFYSYEKDGDAFSGLWLIDKFGNFKKSLFSYYNVYPVVPTEPNPVLIKMIDADLYSVFDVVNNVIYHFDGNNLTKVYSFDFTEIGIKTVSMFPGVTNLERFDNKIGDLVEVTGIQETNRIIWNTWSYKKMRINTVYDKKKNYIFMPERINLIDGVLGRMLPTDNSDLICFSIDGWECENLKDDVNIKGGIKELINKSTGDDNPILQIYFMKK